MKLHIGGTIAKEEWTILDAENREGVDIVADCTETGLEHGSCEIIYASHVLEHVGHAGALKTLEHWHDLLKPNGKLMVAVPDIDLICKLWHTPPFDTVAARQYLLAIMYGGQTTPHDYHSTGFNGDILSEMMYAAGFSAVRRVNSFNEFQDSSALAFPINGENRLVSVLMIAIK